MSFPAIESNRLVLSEIQPEDQQAIFALFSNEVVVQYYDLAAFTKVDQAMELIGLFKSRHESETGIRWAIRVRETGSVIGTCGFNSWNSKMRNAVIGYDLMPDFWGQGFAREAVSLIVSAAFDGKLACGALHRIQADTVPGNYASEKLLRAIGFKEEGLRRESGFWKNRFHDLKCFGLLSSDI